MPPGARSVTSVEGFVHVSPSCGSARRLRGPCRIFRKCPADSARRHRDGARACPADTALLAQRGKLLAAADARESIDQKKIADTVNTVDTPDGIKYLPSLFVRKRNNGDTQPTVAPRTWGINSSARTLVYVDDVPIAAPFSNNNTTGAPRWGMVAPEEIRCMDALSANIGIDNVNDQKYIEFHPFPGRTFLASVKAKF